MQALKVLLANHAPDDPPIIISCQTNHALDQLLRHVAQIEPECFVRLGGRSQDKEVIKPRTLFEVRTKDDGQASPMVRSAHRNLDTLMKEMKDILSLFLGPKEPDPNDPPVPFYDQKAEPETGVPITVATFKDHNILSAAQCDSITDSASMWSTAGSAQANFDALSMWANTKMDSTDGATTAADIFEFEEVRTRSLPLVHFLSSGRTCADFTMIG